MRLIAKIALTFGREVAAALVYPICAYYLLFSPRARRASRDYLRRVRPSARWIDSFRHYRCFAMTILDRVFLQAGRLDLFAIENEGGEIVEHYFAARESCLLIGAHFGSFDMLRAIAEAKPGVDLRVLMHSAEAAKFDSVMRTLGKRNPAQAIALGQATSMLAVRDVIARGGIVALLADRSITGDRLASCDFLGSRASFPQGPFALAALLDLPVVLFCADWRGGRRYAIRFERFPPPAMAARSLHTEGRRSYDAECQAFARWLEARCRESPYNWFNFYDFWAPIASDRAPR